MLILQEPIGVRHVATDVETVISEPLLKARDCDRRVLVRQSVDKAEFQDSSVEKILKLLFNPLWNLQNFFRHSRYVCFILSTSPQSFDECFIFTFDGVFVCLFYTLNLL